MSSALDMSLDDLIKSNKKSGGGGGGGNFRGRGGRGSAAGPARRIPNRSGNRPAPYATGKASDAMWQHDMYSNQMAAVANGAPSIETGTKLYISNLEYGVSNEDIKGID